MGKWKKGATEFEVGLHHDGRRGCLAIIPKSVVERLGVSEAIVFRLEGGRGGWGVESGVLRCAALSMCVPEARRFESGT